MRIDWTATTIHLGAERRNKLINLFEQRLLPYGLPALLAVVLGVLIAYFIRDQEMKFILPLIFIAPAMVLLLKYPFAAILIWMVVFPFVLKDPSASGRVLYNLLHRVMIPVALIIAVIADLTGLKRQRPVRLTIAELGMALFLVLAAANIIFTNEDLRIAFERLYDRIIVPFCLYGLVRFIYPKERHYKILLWTGLLTITVQVGVGILSWASPGLLPAHWLNRVDERTVGTFGNPAVYSSTLIFLSIFILQAALRTKNTVWRAVLMGFVGLAFFGVLFTFSRGSWLGGVLVLVGYVYLHPRLMKRFLLVGLALMFLVGLYFASGYSQFALERLTNEKTAGGRIVGGVATMRLIQTKPIFGWGYGNHEKYDEQFRSRVGDIPVNNEHTSHNTYLLIAAELGLVGLAIYMSPVLWLLKTSIAVRKRMPRGGYQGWAFLGMLWLLIVDHLAVSNFTDLFQSNIFGLSIWWMALGMIASLVVPYLDQKRVAEFTPMKLSERLLGGQKS